MHFHLLCRGFEKRLRSEERDVVVVSNPDIVLIVCHQEMPMSIREIEQVYVDVWKFGVNTALRISDLLSISEVASHIILVGQLLSIQYLTDLPIPVPAWQ